MSEEQEELAQKYYEAGKTEFERGEYRRSIEFLEKAVTLVPRGSKLGGEAQIWLVTAYEAADRHEEAITLCSQVSRHPHPETAKQGRRLLYILKAPRLQTRPEWLTQIPDLTNLDKSGAESLLGQYKPNPDRPRPPKPEPEPEVVDLSQVNMQDNRFIWVALGAIGLAIGGLWWFSGVGF